MTDGIHVGDVLRLKRWVHCVDGDRSKLEFTFSTGRTGTVAVMLYLGTEPRDGSNPLDLEGRMKALGWVRDTAQEIV